MKTIVAPCSQGEVIHVWFKASDPRAPSAMLAVDFDDQRLVDAVVPTSNDYLRHEIRVPGDGKVELAWDERETSVSLAYAFHADEVLDKGVRLLWTTESNRRPEAGPRFHYRPQWGWMNDPNGFCRNGDHHHLFYQHYPHARHWNTMHWGHAVSRDLIHWVDLPVFLFPRTEQLIEAGRSNGGAFSGSVRPVGNDGAFRVYYTDHEEDRVPNMEQQMTALSADGVTVGPSSTIVGRRPDFPGFRKDFRDPYVCRGPDGLLKMLVGGRDADGGFVLLYETRDLEGAEGWTFIGILYRCHDLGLGPLECPCLVKLSGEGEGLWALFFGVLQYRELATGRRNPSLAVVGRFDGRHFEPVAEREIDFGTDCYAFQVYPDEKGPIGIGWVANWTNIAKGLDFPTCMTLPRRVFWRDGALRIAPDDAVLSLRGDVLSNAVSAVSEPIALPEHGGAELEMVLERAGAPFTILFSHPNRHLALVYDGESLEFEDRAIGQSPMVRYLTHGVSLTTLRIFIDIGVIEIFADDGRWCCTRRIASTAPVSALAVTARVGTFAKETLRVIRPAD